ncbi:MAG: competence protein CoiA family protein [Chloroflexota bacterium]
MFLEYGVNTHGEYVHISQSARGRTALQCPYCQTPLIAKKGQQLTHHFAHDGDTCRDSTERLERLIVPLFDRFHMHLSGDMWQALQDFHDDDVHSNAALSRLVDLELVQQSGNPYSREYVLTNAGKVPFGEATLEWFAGYQMGNIFAQHNRLVNTIRAAAGWGVFTRGRGWNVPPPRLEQIPAALADLNLYRAQVARLFNLRLYLLEIDHSTGTLHKVGVTSRQVDERIAEIERDLKSHIDVKKIKPVRVLEHRGSVERYALHRYRQWAAPIGTHGEYFQFEAGRGTGSASWVKGDFTRLADFKPLAGDERHTYDNPKHSLTPGGLMSEILAGERAAVAVELDKWNAERDAEHQRRAHRQATIEGMERAKAQGTHVGRPGKSADDILNEYPAVVDALREGASLRKAAAAGGVSPNTARRVRDVLREVGQL